MYDGKDVSLLLSHQSSVRLGRLPMTSGNSEKSFWPMSRRDSSVSRAIDLGRTLRWFSRSSKIFNFDSLPKFAGRYSRKVSFR